MELIADSSFLFTHACAHAEQEVKQLNSSKVPSKLRKLRALVVKALLNFLKVHVYC